ncbi:flagellar hook-length control protein FliK [Mariprofundus ferrooxydans]|uniref:Flagellar hook-length control protein-like C-terminal domain-containing protein n=1 Tax=Mariprofundus ferrooxydans PV-1 TaxID=314345 RepID=Q0EYB4_9PROT|nr:flagellar hook-length control protein FliK [Mariprofundus ferrooxydans]EAU54278.1 hypothetical protein SPV1_05939 [Mariprofundus ferrooxydans PV-1]KON47820.1 hypothetical protein AL013_06300 [Mariprofundus ferrooxydans]
MPEQRVDSIARSEATGWSTAGPSRNAAAPLRILTGQPGNLPTGEVITAMVSKARNNGFKVTLNGETFTLKGLPASLIGKQVDFIAQHSKSGGKTITQLFRAGIGRKAAGTHLAIRSPLPEALQTGNRVSARVEVIRAGQMQLRIAGGAAHNHPLITTTTANVKTGQMLNGVLQHVDGKPALLLSRPQVRSESHVSLPDQAPRLTPATSSENFNLANTRPGTTTLAIVEKTLGNGRAQLSLQGNHIETPAPPSVAAGDGLIIRVGDKPTSLEVLSVHQNVIGKAHALLRQQAASNMPLTETLTAIRNLLAPLPAESLHTIPVLSQLQNWLSSVTVDHDTSLNGERLSNMIQHSGQLLEHKLRNLLHSGASPAATLHDLKSIMLSMASGEAKISNMHHLTQLLSELGHSASSRIESTQALNVLTHAQHADATRIELPMLVNQQMVNVQLSLEQHSHSGNETSGGQGEQAPCKVLIALEMSGLGKLRVDASISEMSVHARIHHTSHEARSLMQSHIERLESRLLNLGFKEVYLLATPAQPEQQVQERFEQLEQAKPASSTLLDIRI